MAAAKKSTKKTETAPVLRLADTGSRGSVPSLVVGESEQAYQTLLDDVKATVRPRDFIEELWVEDVVNLTWEMIRLRRAKNGAPARASKASVTRERHQPLQAQSGAGLRPIYVSPHLIAEDPGLEIALSHLPTPCNWLELRRLRSIHRGFVREKMILERLIFFIVTLDPSAGLSLVTP